MLLPRLPTLHLQQQIPEQQLRSLPTIAFLDACEIAIARKESLTYMYKPRVSPPTWRLYKKHLARLAPADPKRDAYIVALLIAMAQEKPAASRGSGSISGATHNHLRAHALLSSIDESYLLVYN
ncbi:hypothetical protein LY78DRAFT_687422 [Colletotrichum sublineola]|nr:hypothetical protein LY78DRAFT_687422 [Colletotrichum sublineola]